MICFRCGHQEQEEAAKCSNCGQVFGEARKINRTVTSFKALELRKSRLEAQGEDNRLSTEDKVEGRYAVEGFIGRGPLGAVYKANDAETGRPVALKVLEPALYASASERATVLEALDEASRHSATRVLRPQVITHGDLIIVRTMFVTGISLAKLIRQRRARSRAFSLAETFPRIRQLHEAVADLYADKAHGLLKPENIILLPDGLRVTDYGLAQAIDIEALIQAQQSAGTSAYLAPEIADGGERPNPRSDIFSMGVIFSEMLTNVPWEGSSALRSHLEALFDEPEKVDQLFDFACKATAEEPADRFPSLASFSSALSDLSSAIQSTETKTANVVAVPESKVTLTVQDMPALTIAPMDTDTDTTLEMDGMTESSIDASSDDSAMDVSSVEYVLSGSGNVISDEAEFLERVPTKVEATHTNAGRSPVKGVPTGIMEQPPSVGLGSNRNFAFMVLLVVLLGGGGIWTILSLSTSSSEKPKVKVSKGTATETKAVDSPVTSKTLKVVDATPSGTLPKDITRSGASTTKEARQETNKTAQTAKSLNEGVESKPDQGDVGAAQEAANQKIDPKSPQVKAESKDSASAVSDAGEGTKSVALQKVDGSSTNADGAPKIEKGDKKPDALKSSSVSLPTVKATNPVVKAKAEVAKPEVKATKDAASSEKTKTAQAPANDGANVACPSGMRLIQTKKFPKGSVSNGKIIGEKAVGIAKTGGAYCIDTYEYPGAGSRPKVNVTRTTAAALCKRADKRLCSGREWRSACTGRGGSVFPYGRSFNANKCATEDDDGEERSIGTAGKFRKCRSASGAYDMVGNAAEWTVDGRVRGGHIASSDEDASCSASEARSPSYRGGRVGFRCCSDFRDN